MLTNQDNSQQRISWLSDRWRTQRNAIRSVNCRNTWIIESLNAYCARGFGQEHVCLSVGLILALLQHLCLEQERTWLSRCLIFGSDAGSAEVQRLMHGPAYGPLLGRQLVANALVDGLELCLSTQTRNFGPVPKQTPIFSTWAQARLPAELKHINKRRKRN